MSTETTATDTADRPKFRGCVFCYAGEWAYYGAKKAVGAVGSEPGRE